ncbi:hypothetical protein [Vibrio astriarenae]|uniref:hypothetical protein n=1 Tax=Vibrio astriarenae TaxID=1481923 RepID=UPI00373586C6
MKLRLVESVCILILGLNSAQADDSERNATAGMIKSKLETVLRKQNFSDNSYCEVMIEMEHSHQYAQIKRVSSRGDYKLCKESERWLKKGKKFRYKEAEKFIRLQLVANEL